MTNPEDDIEFEDWAIARFLEQNSTFHSGKEVGFHSWPCHVWRSYPVKDEWEIIVAHGMMPRNWFILREDEDEETE